MSNHLWMKRTIEFSSPIPPHLQHKPQKNKGVSGCQSKQLFDKFLLQRKETISLFYQKYKKEKKKKAIGWKAVSQEKNHSLAKDENSFETCLNHHHPFKNPLHLSVHFSGHFPRPNLNIPSSAHTPLGIINLIWAKALMEKKITAFQHVTQAKFRQKQVTP